MLHADQQECRYGMQAMRIAFLPLMCRCCSVLRNEAALSWHEMPEMPPGCAPNNQLLVCKSVRSGTYQQYCLAVLQTIRSLRCSLRVGVHASQPAGCQIGYDLLSSPPARRLEGHCSVMCNPCSPGRNLVVRTLIVTSPSPLQSMSPT